MKNKTCGECKHYIAEMYHCQKNDVMAESFNTCEDFEPEVITNGDKIRKMSNEELKDVIFGNRCYYCAFKTENDCCSSPNSKDCPDGIEAWLNAPADCVKQNGNYDTQADLCKVDNTESEVEDE